MGREVTLHYQALGGAPSRRPALTRWFYAIEEFTRFYAGDNPVNSSDPSGLAPQPPTLSPEEEQALSDKANGLLMTGRPTTGRFESCNKPGSTEDSETS